MHAERRPRPLTLLLVAGALACAACSDDAGGPSSSDLAPDGPCEALWEVQQRLGTRIDGPVPATLRLADYTIFADGRVIGPEGGSCVDTVAQRLAALCEPCRSAPGGCEAGVRDVFGPGVPAGCIACGDGVCVGSEDEASCPEDCLPQCGDGFCIAPESDTSCPSDCAVACGDGLCDLDEQPETCPQDCTFTVGDGVCSPGENPALSPADCQAHSCGDGHCQSYESSTGCPGDCCWPRLCEPGQRHCASDTELAECVEDGPGNCPGLAVLETCAAGSSCTTGPTGPACTPLP